MISSKMSSSNLDKQIILSLRSWTWSVLELIAHVRSNYNHQTMNVLIYKTRHYHSLSRSRIQTPSLLILPVQQPVRAVKLRNQEFEVQLQFLQILMAQSLRWRWKRMGQTRAGKIPLELEGHLPSWHPEICWGAPQCNLEERLWGLD